MQHFIADNHAALVFQKGEPFIAGLTEFCERQGVTAATFDGLGSVLSAEIGYYHLDSREYEFHKLEEVLEIVSLHGTVAEKDGHPFVHAHGVFSNAQLKTYGGHIKEFIVGGTCELQLRIFSGTWQRIADAETGLSLIDFHE